MALIRSSSDPRLTGDNYAYESTSSKYMTLGHLKHKRIEKITDQQKRQWLSKRSENGFVRFYRPSGQQHVTVPLTTQMTALQVCEAFDLDPLYLSIGNQQIKQLSNDNRPLQMQNEILMTLGYSSIQECLSIGGSEHLSHIFCFFTGRPLTSVQHGISNILLVANCLVGRGRILQRWSKKRCILYNDTIRIENESGSSRIEGDEDSILLLNKYRVELADSNHGRCLRLSSSVQKICFVFEDSSDLQLWSAHATQCSIAPNCDLSDRQLLFLPDKLFYVGSQRMITNLNLRRNSLLLKPTNTIGSPLIGWLDDVARFPSLRTLNIADNSLYTFPHSVVQLTALMELNLSGNRISILPSNIRMLANLTSLNLSNNLLTTLPKQLAACQMLNFLDLSFNRFQNVPEVLFMMPKLTSWEISGNYISNLNFDANISLSINKLDLRLNTFERPLKLTSFFFEAMTVLDLRRAGSISELDLSNLSTIQVIYCSYLSLKTIQVNGNRLREFYAEHNELTQVIVMPIPSNLTILSISHNSLSFLPEWITDLHKVVTISAHHNQISKLPYRIMMNMSSLRHLLVGNNKLTKLPDIVENCAIEVLNIENNFITKLPAELFKSAHHLRHINLTNNCLTELPAMNSFHDLNRLQTMKLSGNQLTETSLSSIVACRKLRILDISYNNFRFFNDSALSQLTFLEEINLSGNLLSSLSTEISQLPSLQILRAHSNRIANIPDLSFSKSLKIIDLSNNRLAKLKVEYCVAENLKFLDLTCNPFSDETINLSIKSERRAISIVDISKRSALSNIQFGFSETPGQKTKQSTQQLRPKNMNDITFAIIDGGSNPEITDVVKSTLKHHLEAPNRDDPEMLRRAILRTHEDIGKKGIRLGASAFILRINEGQIICTSSGHISAMLSRRDGEVVYLLKEISITTKEEYERLRLSNAIITTDVLINGVASSGTAIGYTFLYPAVVPNPRLHCINCTDEDDFIVIANRVVWQSLSEREIIEAVKQCTNSLQAAKRLQDMCQAHEQIGNISIIVIKFTAPNKDGTILRNGGFHRFPTKEAPFSPPPTYSPISLPPMETYQAKPFHLRSFSEQRVNQSTLKNIENRLKKISVAINRIDSDSSGIYYVNPPNANENKTNGRSTLRKIKDRHKITEARLSNSHSDPKLNSSPHGYILNYDKAIHHHHPQQSPQSIQYLLPDIANVESFSPITSDTATTSEDSSVFSQEKFQEVRKKVEKQLNLDKPYILPKQNVYIRRHHF
uniref:PPM-type phosphatase domain-containing protein n=1 Tax=Panagrolaimus sp. PS1159 TaxID=55785 RepID=A0AC35GDY6_9BILA